MHDGVSVVAGKFTVDLDFGADAFDNSNRWLEVVVEGTSLEPRNLISRVPYAIQTRGIFVDDNYNVAIGAAIPEAQLHLQANNNTTLRLENDLAPNSFTALRNDSGTRAVLQKVGDAGGALIDIDPLTVTGATDATLRFFRSTNTTGLKRVLFNRGNGTTQTSALIGLDGADSYFQIQGGNVGIGTPSPMDKLQVETDSPIAISGHSSNFDAAAVFGHASATVGNTYGVYGTSASAVGVGVYGEATSEFGYGDGVYGVSNSFNGRGVVGIATAPSTVTWGVYGQIESTVGFGVEGRATASSGTTYGVGGDSESATGTGVLGRASSASGQNIGVQGISHSSAGYDFFANGAGVNYGGASSRRWKCNVIAIQHPLEKISQLEGVYFDWDEEHGGHHDVGMIAEDVGKVLPEIVRYEANGSDASGMDYSKLTPLLVEAVKELQQEKDAEISELKLQIQETRQLYDQMVKQNREMQQQIQDLKRLEEQLTSTGAGVAK